MVLQKALVLTMTFEQHLRSYYRTAPVTAWIVAVNCAVWLATAVQSRSVTGSYYHSSLALSWSLWAPNSPPGTTGRRSPAPSCTWG